MAAVGVPSGPHRARNGWRARAGAEWHRGPPLHKALAVIFGTVDEPPPNESARFFVLALAAFCLVAAGLLYLKDGPMLGVWSVGGFGAAFFALFLFGSAASCQRAIFLLTIGGIGSW